MNHIKVKNTPKYYQDSVEALRGTFKQLNLIIDGEAAIRIIDPIIFTICKSLWDTDEDGFIMRDEAKIPQKISENTFGSNTSITSFNEFKYFNYYSYDTRLFKGCTSLRSIELPNVNITMEQFCECTALEKCIISEDCISIGQKAFYFCSSLKNITIPKNVTQIQNLAFSRSGIENFVIPQGINNVDCIGECDFLSYVEIMGNNVSSISGFDSCSNLNTFILHSTTPPATTNWTFRNSKVPSIYVPNASVAAYKSASSWIKWAEHIKPISEKP